MTGFTGVIWDARTTDRLASDLGAGAGPAPLAETGMAWASVAADLGEAAVEYSAILARLRMHWQSAHIETVIDHLARLGTWLSDAAADAATMATRAEAQAAAVAVARLTMPDLGEVGMLAQMRDVATSTAAVAPVLAGAAAQTERAVHDQKQRAVRVMQTYEAASGPVSRPWRLGHRAPNLVSDDALAAEDAARQAAARPVTPATPHVGQQVTAAPGAVTVFAATVGDIELQPIMTRYAPTLLASEASGVAPVPASAPAPATAASVVPPPVGAGGAMLGTDDRSRTDRVPETEPAAARQPQAAAADDTPATWADVVTSDVPLARHAVDPTGLDPKYLTETLSLESSGGAS